MQSDFPQAPRGDVIERTLALRSGEGLFRGLPLLLQGLVPWRCERRAYARPKGLDDLRG